MECKNIFCQSYEADIDTANCQVTFSFDRQGCEKRKLFNRLMRESDYQSFKEKIIRYRGSVKGRLE